MKLHLIRLLGAFALVVSFGAWAQAPAGLNEALIDVVPPNQGIDVNDPELQVVPIGADADPEGVSNSRFGRATAFRAQQLQHGFGEAVSEAAQEMAAQKAASAPKPAARP